MNFQLFITIIVVLLFLAAFYSTNSKRHKIFVFYRGRDKTLESRWINVNDSWVILDNKKFHVNTRRIVSFWYKGGIHWLFPTKVNCLEYNWNSPHAHNPDNYIDNWETPEVRKVLNTEELVRSYGKGFTPQTTKKQGIIMQYLPLIAVGLVVLLAFWVYMNFNNIAASLNSMGDKINSIVK